VFSITRGDVVSNASLRPGPSGPAGETAGVAAARPRPVDPARGTNQIGVRLYNERLALSLIRAEGMLPKAEIARRTGLAAQTISVIMRQLEGDSLVIERPRRRGRIGQPSVPYALNPEGAYALGLKIGRRSNDIVLLNLLGEVVRSLHEAGRYPTPAGVADFVARGIATLTASLSPENAARISGLGIAAPFELWNWEEQIGAPHEVLEQWRTFDLRDTVARMCPWPVVFYNDASAACAAELFLGTGTRHRDFLYFYVGYFIGGGLVLNGHLHLGGTGNAGAFGSMPVATPGGGAEPLIRSASIYRLEQMLVESARDASVLWRSPDDWGDLGPALDAWIEQVASGIAFAATAAVAVVDVPSIIIDGGVPATVRARIVAGAEAAYRGFDRRGLAPVRFLEGSIGTGARAIGAACLPLMANFALDRGVLFKDEAVR
jgi:predicted NBD/HSP70 family sugar kinase